MASAKNKSSITPPSSTTSPVDSDLVARAYRKVMDRQELTGPERQALKRHEKDKQERLRWQYYRSIPQKHWRMMSGRQTKVLNEQATRYGLPFGGPTIDLTAVVRSLHDFLARNALKLARDDEELLPGSQALERYRQERAELARIERLQRQRRLLPRDQVRQALARIAGILRGAADTLQQQFGPTAVEVLHEALDEAQREMDRSFEEVQDQDDHVPDPQ